MAKGMPPRKFFEMNMRWDAICCILRPFSEMLQWYFILKIRILHVPCYIRQRILTSCALTSSRLDDFSDIVTYIP